MVVRYPASGSYLPYTVSKAIASILSCLVCASESSWCRKFSNQYSGKFEEVTLNPFLLFTHTDDILKPLAPDFLFDL